MIDPKRAPSELEGVVVGNLLIVMSCIDDYDPKPVRAAIENGRNRMNVPDMSQISSKRSYRVSVEYRPSDVADGSKTAWDRKV